MAWGAGRRTFSTLRNLSVKMNSQHLPPAFLPPMNKSMKELDRSFFKKSIALSAFTIFDNKNISLVKQSLQHSGDLLDISPLHRMVEEDDGRKALLLKPDMKAEGSSVTSICIPPGHALIHHVSRP